MISLSKSNIYLNQRATDQAAAISLMGEKMVASGLTRPEYVDGLKAREHISSTFLGHGIAIPHGTPETRDAVNKTGVIILQFPQGVDWGDDNRVFLAVGIAARSHEHLKVLSGLSRILDNEVLCRQLAQTQCEEDILNAIEGRVKPVQSDAIVHCYYTVESLQAMKDRAATALGREGYLPTSEAEQLALSETGFMGSHIAMIRTTKTDHTGVAMVSSRSPVIEGDRSIRLMLAVAANDNRHLPVLKEIRQWQHDDHWLSQLDHCTAGELLRAASGQGWPENNQSFCTRQLVIKNIYGLHARPCAVIVSVIKPFNARVEIRSMDNGGNFVNARSLMKLLGLGVSRNTTVEVRPNGPDALNALDALEMAIAQGLGE